MKAHFDIQVKCALVVSRCSWTSYRWKFWSFRTGNTEVFDIPFARLTSNTDCRGSARYTASQADTFPVPLNLQKNRLPVGLSGTGLSGNFRWKIRQQSHSDIRGLLHSVTSSILSSFKYRMLTKFRLKNNDTDVFPALGLGNY
jgi:hypothetical protein